MLWRPYTGPLTRGRSGRARRESGRSKRKKDEEGGLPQPVTSVTGFAMTHYKKCIGRADVGIGPYGSATRGAMGGRPQGSPLRKRYKGGRGERNPPVTASPCQGPLSKGAGEDGRKQGLFDTLKPPPGGGGFRRGICGEGDLRGGGLFSVGRF